MGCVVSESVVVVCEKLVERGEEWSGGAALGGRGGDVGCPRWLPLIIIWRAHFRVAAARLAEGLRRRRGGL
jgi:hypothetical protein